MTVIVIVLYCYRRLLRISWVKKVTNEEVLRRIDCEKTLLDTINERKLKFVGHVLCGKNLTKLLLTGMVIGPRGRGWDAVVRLTEGADWSYDGGGWASGTGPGEVERHGAEGHGWSTLTHPLMMMMIVIVQQLSDIYRSRNVFIIEEI